MQLRCNSLINLASIYQQMVKGKRDQRSRLIRKESEKEMRATATRRERKMELN